MTARAKELMDSELLAMSDDITRHPEIGFQEKRSVALEIDYLKRHGFEVATGQANLATAFVARYQGKRDAPCLGIIVEYDALRGTQRPFHGDQHSAQGPIGLAAAVALAEFLDRSHTPGSVVVFGTPGEEMMPPVAKTDMFKEGVFNGTDVIVRSHSTHDQHAAGAGVRHLLPQYRRRQVYVFRSADAPDDALERTQRPGSRDSPVHQYRRRAQHHAAGSAGAGSDRGRRRRAQRGARPHGGRLLYPLPRRGLPGAGARVRGQCGARGGALHRDQGEDRQLRQPARRDFA